MSRPTGRISVLVIAEDPYLRQRICRALPREPSIHVVAAFDGVAAAREPLASCLPAVIVATPRVVGSGSETALRTITEASPDSRLVVVAGSAPQEAVLDALGAGARGYLIEAAVDTDLATAVVAVASGGAWLSPPAADRLIDEFVHLPSTLLRDSLRTETYLTQREQSVLARLALGMTNREIARSLDIAETTVKTHLTSILEKLQAKNRLEAASIALKLALSAPTVRPPSAPPVGGHPAMDSAVWSNLMSNWASGVSVLTSLGALGPRGCTVSSLASLSPSLLLVCFDLDSNTLAAVRESGRFCINILGAEHEELSRRFARKDSELPLKFEGVDYRVIESTPVLEQRKAWIVCAVESEVPGGDYAVMLARPVAGGGTCDGPPLVFYQGEYWGLQAPGANGNSRLLPSEDVPVSNASIASRSSVTTDGN
jgi:DNA-binding NarL/FixJ family response regulator/flavin reductase (DIM6/NTAB) family NADH-FMN oxidoreductase RutF